MKDFDKLLIHIKIYKCNISQKNILDMIEHTQNNDKAINFICEVLDTINEICIIPETIYLELAKKNFGRSYAWDSLYFPLTDTFKKSLYEFACLKKIRRFDYNFPYEDSNGFTNNLNDDELTNLLHIYLMFNNLYAVKELCERDKKIKIDKECLKYSDLSRYKDVRDYVRDNMYLINIHVNKIAPSDTEENLFKNDTTDKIDNFIIQNNYKITENTIIIACQKNINQNIIKHLITYKIEFTENGVNEIIKSYLDNKNINKIILTIQGYYNFTQNNYYMMTFSKYYYKIFKKNLHNIIFDDKITDYFAKSRNNTKDESDSDFEPDSDLSDEGYPHSKYDIFQKFVMNIRDFASKSEENKNNILALYCLGCQEKEILKFVKDFKCKMTTKSLLFLYKNKSAIKKKIMDLFVKDKVKPDFDVLLQYIDTFSRRKEQQFLFNLLEIK
jgi:hypothetical protein